MSDTPSEIIRHCVKCSALIEECMGYILARDQLALMRGERIIPRELCGKCGLWPADVARAWIAALVDSLPQPRRQSGKE